VDGGQIQTAVALLGDEGSGSRISLEAIKAALEAWSGSLREALWGLLTQHFPDLWPSR